MYSDPIADLLTRIRNAGQAGLPSVDLPASRLKIELVKLLQREGYIRSHELKENEQGHQSIRILLKYDEEGFPVIRTIKRVSRPGLRKYSKVGNLPKVLSGAGIAVVTTNKGLLTDREARKQGVGGEILCTVQ